MSMSQYPVPPSNGISNHPTPVTNTDAQVSLGAGIAGLILIIPGTALSFCGLPIVTALGAFGALHFGYKARREIAASNGAMAGSGMASTGIVLGWINAVISALSIIFFIVMIVIFVRAILSGEGF